MHVQPQPRFFVRNGSYRPRCRTKPVPRFLCRHCGRNFSRQTFRLDYRDRRPESNPRVFELLVSGVGLRQTGRVVGLSVRGVQHKFRKLARAMRQLNRNLLRRLPRSGQRTFLLDELETFEQSSILPVSVPVLVERSSLAILGVDTAPIRRAARRGSARQRWLSRHELVHGRRRDRSKASLRRMLARFRRLLGGQSAHLITDEKALYAALLRDLAPGQVTHETVSSRRIRTVSNPLFPVNLTDAMLRDNNGRLRRRSWLVSKTWRQLRNQLELFAAYRNWLRPRTNVDRHRTSGVVLGLAERPFALGELLAWRQDWRERSIHPTSQDAARAIGRLPVAADAA